VVVDGVSVSVALSMGCTTAVAGDTIDTVFARADRGLYIAKQAGRNAARFVDPEDLDETGIAGATLA
jgi:predicted signal transduction protein with EAL and GGDEF domain